MVGDSRGFCMTESVTDWVILLFTIYLTPSAFQLEDSVGIALKQPYHHLVAPIIPRPMVALAGSGDVKQQVYFGFVKGATNAT